MAIPPIDTRMLTVDEQELIKNIEEKIDQKIMAEYTGIAFSVSINEDVCGLSEASRSRVTKELIRRYMDVGWIVELVDKHEPEDRGSDDCPQEHIVNIILEEASRDPDHQGGIEDE